MYTITKADKSKFRLKQATPGPDKMFNTALIAMTNFFILTVVVYSLGVFK